MSNLNENMPACRVEDNRQAGPLAWEGVTPAPIAELRAAAPITVDQLEHLNPSRTGLGIMERREGGAYVRVADVRRMDATRAAAGVPAHEQDLLDIVRTLCSTAQRLAELSPTQRANYPSPLSPMSPLLQAASAACIERGYTRWGLEIEGAAYPTPAAQPAPVAAGVVPADLMREAASLLRNSMFQFCDTSDKASDLADRISAVLASLAPVAAEPVRQWIDLKVQKPKDWQRVLVALDTGTVATGYRGPSGWYWDDTGHPEDAAANATHWQPWPDHPRNAAPHVPTAAEVRAAALEEAAVFCETKPCVTSIGAAAAIGCAVGLRELAAAPSVEVKGEQGEMGGKA